MALETLVRSQQEAAKLTQIDFAEVEEFQKPEMLVRKQATTPSGIDLTILRAHSGHRESNDSTGKGGNRMTYYPTLENAEDDIHELAIEMLWKLSLLGKVAIGERSTSDPNSMENALQIQHSHLFQKWHGAKGGLVLPSRQALSKRDRLYIADAAYDAMEEAGLANYLEDVPASDVGTDDLMNSRYARRHRLKNPNDPMWQAVITGKTVSAGGMAFRPASTGWGSYNVQRTIQDTIDPDTITTNTTMGFGQVGAYHSYYASRDPLMRQGAISDRLGMIYTEHPQGLKLTLDMVERIGDNKSFTGDKMAALGEEIDKKYPHLKVEYSSNPNDIISYPAHYLTLAAMPNALNDDSVRHIGATIGVIEAGNGPTTPEAQQFLQEKGLIVSPDIATNGTGADSSIIEWHINAAMAEGATTIPDQKTIKNALALASSHRIRRVMRMAQELGIPADLRTAAAALSICSVLRPQLVKDID